METPVTPWKPWQKIGFRSFFIFLSVTSTLCWLTGIVERFLKYDYQSLYKVYGAFSGLFYWLDRHIYHLGYEAKTQRSLPVDNHYGAVYYLSIFLFAVIVTIAWSVLDKKRPGYPKLSYWFNMYLRYTLAITMVEYGIEKVIPVQMPYPGLFDTFFTLGNMDRSTALWYFMGMSPGYLFFTGACEVIASLLLLSRRTAVFGYVFMLTILGNVVAINWFYNINVKLFSSLLLLITLYLLAPYLRVLFQLFFSGEAVTIPRDRFAFKTRWKSYVLMAVLVLVPFADILATTIDSRKIFRDAVAMAKKEKLYKVISFRATDSLAQQPLADTLRWKRVLLFINDNSMVTYDLKDKYSWYKIVIDSTKKTLTLTKPGRPFKALFNYTSVKDSLKLSGKWKGRDITVSLKLSPVDSLPINKEKIKLLLPEND